MFIILILVDLELSPPPMSVPALHSLLIHDADNQLTSGAFLRFRQLVTTTTQNLGSINVLSTQANPTTIAVTGQAALTVQQKIYQQAQRNRMKYQ